MSEFKVGDVVECSCKNIYEFITVGKEYCVFDSHKNIKIINDIGELCDYNEILFKLKESKMKLNGEEIKVGDVIESGGRERKILGICGEVVFLSNNYDHDNYGGGYTLDDMKFFNYKLKKQDEISVTVKVNGKEVDPSTVSKETWENIRGGA